ncbi:MAG: DUF4279 domain-containing protein [Hyphomicrobiaceae bacterium]
MAEVGGPVGEVGVTLAIYGEELDPEEITRTLGVAPTKAHRRGERPKRRSGKWLGPPRLEERGFNEPSEAVIDRVLRKLPEGPAVWRELGARYDIQLRFGIHMTGWNQGMGITSEQVVRLAQIGAKLEFDIYAYGDDE